MRESPGQSRKVRFGVFEVDLQEGEVRRAGLRQKLGPQPFQLLQAMLERPGQLITREELRERLWPEKTFVDHELALKKCINRIREILGDSAESPRFVETVPRRGYRFIAPIEEIAGASAAAHVAPLAEQDRPAGSSTQAFSIPLNAGAIVPSLRRARMWMRTVASAVLLAMLWIAVKTWLGGPIGGLSIHSLAVLPLQNLSSDPAQEYFSDGMTDALITDLAQIGSVKVISRTSIMRYRKSDKPLPEIGRELSVDGIVEGTVQRSGDRVRITAQLIRASDDRHLWANTFDRELADILELQDEVARTIADQVRATITPAEKARLSKVRPVEPQAYEDYLKGRYFWNKRTAEDFQKALSYFQQASGRAPDYGPSYAGLADTYALLGAAGYDVLPSSEAGKKARSAALRALQIDDTIAEAHASLAFVTYSYDWDWLGAEREFKRAIDLNPNYATAHQWYSELLNDLGRRGEALAQAQAALVLDPLSLSANLNVARAYYFAHRFDDAIESAQKTLEMDPYFAIAHLRLGRAYAAKGTYDRAIKEFQEFSKLSGDVSLATASIGNALARSGDRSGASRALDELAALSKHKRVPSICFALIHVGLGNKGQAIAWLEKAYEERSDFLLVLNVDPLFDVLRTDPPFQGLVRRIGLIG